MTYEQDRAQMEADRNAAEDEYFAARLGIDDLNNRIRLASGYELGWKSATRR